MKHYLCLVIACLLAGSGYLFGQSTRTVTGVVVSAEDGLPVIGAAVLEKGTKNASITDTDGRFTIKVSLTAKALEVSCLGLRKSP